MSSFTDQQIQPYAPYTPQLPVEAMAQVGMQRQQMYNQGVQKIQSQIDNVAGLDLYRDVDKNYLQSKLNELGNKLTTVAAGDFSNFQLVNSVSGMTNQLIKDKNVQNAVQSTAHIRKQQSEIEKATKEGKSSLENQWDFNQQLGEYVNNTEVGQVFSGRYTPYIDVNKKIIDLSKAAGVDERIVQQLFQTDKYGNSTGKINEVMAEQHFKGVDKQKLLSEFKTSLTADDYNQLSISGRYNMRGYTPLQLKEVIDHSYSENKSFYEKTNQNNLTEIAGLEAKKSLSVAEQQRLAQLKQDVINTTQTTTTLEEDYLNNLNSIVKNPNQVKASLYTNNYLSSMAKSLAHTEEYTIYKVNPWYEVQMKNKEFAATQDYRAQQQKNWERNFQWEHEKTDAELSLKFGKLFKNGKVVEPGLPTPFNTNQKELGYLSDNQDQIQKIQQALSADNEKLGIEWFKIANKNNPKAPKDAAQYDVWINKLINDQAKYTGDTREQVLDRYAANFVLKYKDNPDYKHLNSTIQRVLNTTNDLHDLQSVDKKAEQDAINKLKLEGVDRTETLHIFDKIPNSIKITGYSGGGPFNQSYKSFDLSKQDIINVIQSQENTSSLFGRDFPNSLTKSNREQAKQYLVAKFGKDNANIILHNTWLGLGGPPADDNFSNNKEIQNAFNHYNGTIYSKYQKYKNEAIKNNPVTQYYSGEINSILEDKDKPQDFKTKLVNIVESLGDKNLEPGYDKQSMISLINDDKMFGTPHILTSTNMDGTHDHKLVITSKDGKEHTMIVPKQVAEVSTGKQFNDREKMDRLAYSLLQSSNKSTNLSNENPNYLTADKAAITARLTPSQFPHVKINGKTVLGGDYTLDDNNSAWMSVYIKNNQTNEVKRVTLSHSFPLTQLSTYPSIIKTSDILNELK